MSQDYRIPRLALAWLLMTQCFLLLPHMLRFPFLVIPAWLLCTIWRVRVFQGRWSMPPALVKVGLVIFSFIAIIVTQKTWLSVEGTVCTLLLAFLLKLMELKKQRDLLITVYLAYFVIVTELLFSTSLFSTLYMVGATVLVTATLVAVQSNDQEVSFFSPVRVAGRMFLFSLPLMLVVFLVFPRLDPLWSVPKPSGQGKTGVSGSMSPGLFSELVKSDALAFRVTFDGEIPAQKSLYWRGVVLSRFDGLTWKPADESYYSEAPVEDYQLSPTAKPLSYRMMMEPSQRHWLFVLAGTVKASDSNVGFARDFTLRTYRRIDERLSLDLEYYPDPLKGEEIYRYQKRQALTLPPGFNPQAIQFAWKLKQQEASDQAIVNRVLRYFREQPFYYSLTPPALGKHTVDEFLFQTRSGFCEHYASAFVFLMRAAGIPARVVAGYQGGEVNPYEGYLSVRQMDAHAWAEVWLPNQGWKRVDPTNMVSPERIEQGSQQALQQQQGFLDDAPFSPRRMSNWQWLTRLGQRYDQLNYRWSNWVLNYQGQIQQNLLTRLLGGFSLRKVMLLVAGGFTVSALLLLAYLFLSQPRQPLAAEEKLYRRFRRKLTRRGLPLDMAEGPMHLRKRVVQYWPEQAGQVDKILRCYIQLRYGKVSGEQQRSRLLKQLRHDVMRFNVVKKNITPDEVSPLA